MKRTALIILGFLLLGAVTSVMVAWGLTIRARMLVSSDSEEHPTWPCATPAGWPAQPLRERRDRKPGAVMVISDAYTRLEEPSHVHILSYGITYFEAGWPLRCLSYRRPTELALDAHGLVIGDPWATEPGDWARGLSVHIPGWLEPDDLRRVIAAERLLPVTPLWPRFAMNTLFYAVILWVVLSAGPRMTWRSVRRRRGRCPQCGYDLQHDLDLGCSECGWRRAEETGS